MNWNLDLIYLRSYHKYLNRKIAQIEILCNRMYFANLPTFYFSRDIHICGNISMYINFSVEKSLFQKLYCTQVWFEIEEETQFSWHVCLENYAKSFLWHFSFHKLLRTFSLGFYVLQLYSTREICLWCQVLFNWINIWKLAVALPGFFYSGVGRILGVGLVGVRVRNQPDTGEFSKMCQKF